MWILGCYSLDIMGNDLVCFIDCVIKCLVVVCGLLLGGVFVVWFVVYLFLG